MTEDQVKSWIFLAIALASQQEPAKFEEITMVADGINHSVPTEKEMRNSLTWLIKEELIFKVNKKYSLAQKGITKYELATKNTKTLLKIWQNLEQILINN